MELIIADPNIMLGKPVIKGTRITVEQIISMLSQGITFEEIMLEYKGIEKPQILACLQFAEMALNKTSVFQLDKLAS